MIHTNMFQPGVSSDVAYDSIHKVHDFVRDRESACMPAHACVLCLCGGRGGGDG